MTSASTVAAPARWRGLALALLLGVALALLSYVRRIGDMNSAMFRHGVMDALLEGRFWGTALARNVLLFAAALLLLRVSIESQFAPVVAVPTAIYAVLAIAFGARLFRAPRPEGD